MSSRQQNWLLSGGIGSGKSTVRELFESRGIKTIDADSVGHEVLAPGGSAVKEVVEAWPNVIVDGVVDRRRLGAIVFADPDQLGRLERITHPHIFVILNHRLQMSAGPVVVEIPLLVQPFEVELPRMVVDTSDAARVERAVARGQPESDVRDRMANQPTRQEWLAASNLVIPNSGPLADLETAVEKVVEAIF